MYVIAPPVITLFRNKITFKSIKLQSRYSLLATDQVWTWLAYSVTLRHFNRIGLHHLQNSIRATTSIILQVVGCHGRQIFISNVSHVLKCHITLFSVVSKDFSVHFTTAIKDWNGWKWAKSAGGNLNKTFPIVWVNLFVNHLWILTSAFDDRHDQ